jgi:hypothetical protein
VVQERAEEEEGSRDVVIGDDQRNAQLLVHVIPHLAKAPHDAFVAPALERPPQIDSDDLAEHSGVDTFRVVVRKHRHRSILAEAPLVHRWGSKRRKQPAGAPPGLSGGG